MKTIRNTSNGDAISLQDEDFDRLSEFIGLGVVDLPSLKLTGRTVQDWQAESGDLFGDWYLDLVDFEFLLAGIQYFGLGVGNYDRDRHEVYWRNRRVMTGRGWRQLDLVEPRGERA